jgi:hypothetical protein
MKRDRQRKTDTWITVAGALVAFAACASPATEEGEMTTDSLTNVKPPTGLAVVSSAPTKIALSWVAPTGGAARYVVYKNGTLAGASTSPRFTLSNLICSTSYEIEVQAEDASGERSPRVSLRSRAADCVRTGAVPFASEGSSASAYFALFNNPVTTGDTVEDRERESSHRFSVVKNYHGFSDAFPSAGDLAYAASGHILFESWEPRNGTPTWKQISNGGKDDVIDAEAARIKTFGKPMFLAFHHEPDRKSEGKYGTPEEFAAAWKHIHDRFAAASVTNVSWVLVTTGSPQWQSIWERLYPGDAYVDWIAWDPYNWITCGPLKGRSKWQSFDAVVSPQYDYLGAHGHGNKPFMLAEFSSHEPAGGAGYPTKGAWWKDVRTTMEAGTFPNLKMLTVFDTNHLAVNDAEDCAWHVDSSAASMDGFRTMVASPYFR